MSFNNENVVYFENADFNARGELALDSHKPVLIMLYGTMCPHCHDVMPIYAALAREAADAAVFGAIVIDGPDADTNLIGRLQDFIPNLQGVPTFILYRNGQYIKTHGGARTAAGFLSFINS